MRHINNWGRPHCWVWAPDAQSLSGKRSYETIRILNITFILLRLAHPSSHPSPPHPHPPPPNHYPYNPSHLPTLPHPLHLPRGGRGDGHGRRPPPAARRTTATGIITAAINNKKSRTPAGAVAAVLPTDTLLIFHRPIWRGGGEAGGPLQEPAGHFNASDFATQEPAGHFSAGTSRTLY